MPHYIKSYIKLLTPVDPSMPKELNFLITKDHVRPLHEILENGQCTLMINKKYDIALTSNNEDAFSCLVSIGDFIQKRRDKSEHNSQTKMEE